jgi:cyclic beta-1,2-glucan synthetase
VVRLTAVRLVDQPPAGAPRGGPERRADPVPARLSRRTWAFFDTFVGPEDHWLPPDNYQEVSRRRGRASHLADQHRLALLANPSRLRLRLSVDRPTVERTANTLRTMDGWSGTAGTSTTGTTRRRCSRCRPLYISTVDSGNLAGHLLTLRAGLLALADDRILPARLFDGLGDTLQDSAGRHGGPRGAGAAPADGV